MSRKKKVMEAEIIAEERTETVETENTEEVQKMKVGILTKIGRGIKANGPKIAGIGAGIAALGGAAYMLWTEHQETKNMMALAALRGYRDEDGYEEGKDDAEQTDETTESETEE